jgi:hypothetical protein
MKKKLLIVSLLVVALIAAVAIADTVNGKNWVGYVKVKLPPAGGFVMVGVNFDAIGGGGVPLNELISTNSLTGHAFFTMADNVYIYDPSLPGYHRYYYNGGTFKDFATGTSTNPVVFSGDAFWLQSSNTSTTTNDIYLLGEVLLADTDTQVLVTSFQQFSNPFATDLNLNSNANWAASGATGNAFFTMADNIYIWNGTGYDRYYFGADDKWRDFVTFQVADNAVIPVGGGAWYEAKGTFTNLLNRPYTID